MTLVPNEMWASHFSPLCEKWGFLARTDPNGSLAKQIQYPNNLGSAVVNAGI
jgi:hypothetical protein